MLVRAFLQDINLLDKIGLCFRLAVGAAAGIEQISLSDCQNQDTITAAA
jgi:hypothetical protein